MNKIKSVQSVGAICAIIIAFLAVIIVTPLAQAGRDETSQKQITQQSSKPTVGLYQVNKVGKGQVVICSKFDLHEGTWSSKTYRVQGQANSFAGQLINVSSTGEVTYFNEDASREGGKELHLLVQVEEKERARDVSLVIREMVRLNYDSKG